MATPRKADAADKAVAALVERDPIWGYLARPFPADWIEKLPKPLKSRDDNKGRCDSSRFSADGHYCGGWHARSLHLDYVGHAGITMRLNEDVGPQGWHLEPMGVNPETGLPVHTASQFWVKLTILGVTKYDVAESFSSTQEAWGDGLRRAAMRFGIGTELWSRSEHAFNVRSNTEQAQETPKDAPAPSTEHVDAVNARISALSEEDKKHLRTWFAQAQMPKVAALSPEQARVVSGELDRMEAEAQKALLHSRLGATEEKVEREEVPA